MSVESDFLALLAADSGIAAITANLFLGLADQQTDPPFIVLTQISPGEDYAFEGVTNYKEKRIQCDVYHTDYLLLLALKDAVKSCVHGVRQRVQGVTNFQGIFVDADQDEFDFDATIEGKKFRRRLDFIVISTGA